MAPVLSLPKICLDRIREAVSTAVVSIWEVDESSGEKTSFRSGFVLHHADGLCIVVTLRNGLDSNRKIFVQFENGYWFEGLVNFGDVKSNLAAIYVDGLSFKPKTITVSTDEARQGDDVIHMGFFDKRNPKLMFSSGTVGLVGHNNTKIHNETFTRFTHCCSDNLHFLGGPVFSLGSALVGVNYSRKRNLFFALDLQQLMKEFKRLFGENRVDLPDMIKRCQELKEKRRKTKTQSARGKKRRTR